MAWFSLLTEIWRTAKFKFYSFRSYYLYEIIYVYKNIWYIKIYIFIDKNIYGVYKNIHIFCIHKITSKAIKFRCVYSHIIYNIYKIIYICTHTHKYIYMASWQKSQCSFLSSYLFHRQLNSFKTIDKHRLDYTKLW